MEIEHRGVRPRIHPTAYVAPTAVVSGDVEIGPDCRILFGAVLTDEGGPIRLGAHVIVMENAVIRSTRQNPVAIGDHSLIGPHTYVVGATIENEVFVATGARIFNGARLGSGSEVRIDAIVHLRTSLPADATVPIGWVAVGDPAKILPPDRHDEIWEAQRSLDFAGYVFGIDAMNIDRPFMVELTERYARSLHSHGGDARVDDDTASI
jgi:carbonic anhydrase/acetyltransferase-like protein (isoleucine patch superfamily)